MSASSIAQAIVDLAEKHLGKGEMSSSAELCVEDARALIATGRHKHAALRAFRSLEYSVGLLHPDCSGAKSLLARMAS